MYTLRIEQDEIDFNPRKDFDQLGVMVCFHDRYKLGDEHDIKKKYFDSWDDIRVYLEKEYNAGVVLPLYLYDHSGISMNTTRFDCRWDSMQVGFIYMDRKTILAESPNNPKILSPAAKKWAIKRLESEVKEYDQYLTGDVWGYIIEDEDGDHIDSCWGFYGYHYCKEYGESELARLNECLTIAELSV